MKETCDAESGVKATKAQLDHERHYCSDLGGKTLLCSRKLLGGKHVSRL